MKYYYALPAALIGASIVLVQPQLRAALPPVEVAQIAKQITVRIDSQEPGSGVIIKHKGKTYTVLTASHVLGYPIIIVTPDGRNHDVKYDSIRRLPGGVDLAIVQFDSKEKYQVAKFGDSDSVTETQTVYVDGFTILQDGQERNWQITIGSISGLSSSTTNRYTLYYTNLTFPGMSGASVLDTDGRLIGIHVKIEIVGQGQHINQGIPLNGYRNQIAKLIQSPANVSELPPLRILPPQPLALPPVLPSVLPPVLPSVSSDLPSLSPVPVVPPPVLFGTIPQITEARQYIEKRWQPPQDLKQSLEYTVIVDVDGTMNRIIPLTEAAKNYINRSGIPPIGDNFVSPPGRKIIIRLELKLDGKVEALLIPF